MLKKINKLWEKAFTAKSAIKFLDKNAVALSELECTVDIMGLEIPPTEKVSMLCEVLQIELSRIQTEIANQPAKPEKVAKVKEQPPYTATIFCIDKRGDKVVGTRFDEKRGEEVELIKSFKSMQAANTWAENAMWNRGDVVNAEIVAHKLIGKHGAMMFTMTREEAMFAKLRIKKGADCKTTASTTAALSFRPKAHEDRSYFSRG